MNVVSVFDGMSCGMIAMLQAGVKIDRYVAYEIDKYAIETSTHNFPEIEHRGDVFDADFTEFKGFDFLIGGSPCTHWSVAQKKNRETEASGAGWELFMQYVRALNEAKPRYFIYENNKSMSPAIRKSISDVFGFDAVCINSALVSAQNRQRLYWVGKLNDDGRYSQVNVTQPIDKKILLNDIIEKCIAKSEPINTTPNGKSQTIKANYHKTSEANICCYSSTYGASGVAETLQNEPVRVGSLPRPNGELSSSQGFRIYDVNAKSVTLKGNAGGSGGKTGLYAIPCEYKEGERAISVSDEKAHTIYKVKNNQITIRGKPYPIQLNDGFYIIRKLTVQECMRAQTIPDWYQFPVSNTQAYKMIGNGWTIDIISHLINECLKANTE